MRRYLVQGVTSVVGIGLLYVAYEVAIQEGPWSLWRFAGFGTAVGLGAVFIVPSAVDRGMEILAPRIKWLHDHEEASCDE